MSWYFEPTKPIETTKGIKAKSKRGKFVENWWATRWIEALERLMDRGRLSRGRRYARKGQVTSLEETKDGIAAKVQGSRRTPYKVSIKLQKLTYQQWTAVLDALAERALFSAQLLAGEMPPDIDEAFQQAGVSLFPERSADLEMNCNCPDWADVCKHVAAVHYILGEQFDADPFLIFRLRGQTVEQLMGALRERRGAEIVEEPIEEITKQPLEETDFWENGRLLANFPVNIKEPATPQPILQRLGQPPFLNEDLQQVLRPAYNKMTETALSEAFSEQDPAEESAS
ncbi:MAG: hypothetical protein AAF614_04705 [Chloroflexota bacterium]